ncbi:transcriptional regulator, LacI family [Cohaesibacter sp. ES.047]|uniref:LacI family DNA-binding transcriptional regulator n=1 Tax=Cohaesibacter sp. ES.047 TaxID=1798205 RepID=UPI000BB97B0B|nr:LacI family DNA-binding transcriptional regulator [Cohaesibacter sp. ES.047]SNY93350.1 transcriptional regulator, LacI family [Cohaesibacter sp. ES.047]
MTTIYDVAKLAGVSPKTVSRVLNGDAPVKKQTKDAVETAMLELGYVPSNAARMMRSNKSGLVGLITGAISHGIEPTEPQGLPDLFIVQGIQQIMGASGKTLMIADTDGVSERVPHLIRTFLQHRVEGIIYVADHHKQVTLPQVPDDFPIVLANCFDSEGHASILPDDRKGQKDLISKLIQSGHRRIGYLTLDRTLVATGLRYRGYREALAEADIPYADELVTMGYEEGQEKESQILMRALERLLSLKEPPTVICCGNDEMALRLYGLLRSRGIKVPEEISVAGYDNYQVIADTLFPPLTTVELPYLSMGQIAAKHLLKLISDSDHKPEKPRLVEGPVCWRSSITALNSVSVLNPKGRNNQ